jgi:ketosteroid isomerase-like protein
MRKSVLAIAICLFVSGCSTSNPATSASPSAQTNSARLRALYEAFAHGDVPTVLATFDADIVWMEAENLSYAAGNPYRGSQAIVQGIFARLGQEWSQFRVTPERFIDGGDTVAVTGRYSGTFKSTGLPVDAQFVHVWTFRNGKIVRMEGYTDTAQFARAMTAR